MTAIHRRIVVVCGYGCNLDSPLKPYLNRVARLCELQKPEHVILCGGATQRRTFPGRTEAGVMGEYLSGKIDFRKTEWIPAWHTLADSYTTYENIRDAAKVINGMNGAINRPNIITIFCEATRALKVAILARHFLGFPPEHGDPDIRIETDSWERMHPLKELVGTLKDAGAIYVPWLNTIQRRQREAKSKVR